MQVNAITTENFRNLQNGTVTFSEKMNVIYGDNAQGKTNLIEAIWLFSGAKSFRGAKDSEMIAFDQEHLALTLSFSDRRREQTAEIRVSGEKKKVTLNRVPIESRAKLAGSFYTVVFAPAHLSIVSEGPKFRRRFLDDAIGQLNPQYGNYLKQYEKVLFQRNTLLKDSARFPQLGETVELWDQQLAKLGSILTIYRKDYLEKLSVAAAKIYSGLSRKKEQFAICYRSTVFEDLSGVTAYDDQTVKRYYDALAAHLQEDRKFGQTSVGIGRDDMEVTIDGKSVKTYGSQGQKRSCALALKLAEAAILKNITKETPIILLDDVMSELDTHRQDYILNHVKHHQVFITCCDISNTLRLKEGKVFRVENGNVTPITPPAAE